MRRIQTFDYRSARRAAAAFALGAAGLLTQTTDAVGQRQYETVRAPLAAGLLAALEAGGRGATARECPDCPEMALAPAGVFRMGAVRGDRDASPEEEPARDVSIDAFAMSVAPITRGEFARFVAETGHVADDVCESYDDAGVYGVHRGRSWRNAGFPAGDDHPVVCVSFDDAIAYIAWLNRSTDRPDGFYRLPSEAEWEYAARAGSTDIYPWGSSVDSGCRFINAADLTALATFPNWTVVRCEDGWVYTAPVGALSPNAFGFRHMIGNVWEWTQDCWHPDLRGAPTDGSAWLETSGGDCRFRVQRGGAWDSLPAAFRASQRSAVAVDDRSFLAGFRVVREFR